ncbi:Short-chain dehydrogenase [Nocardia amikacinitolerans]|uniref:Short-chain dehydrogenase n=1 Tax=Nocardia amikacinitolerans TaxID=756689 RepID=A0A285LYL2_9NOCA|nr:SDR family oxidoreductase [Nocardia amikacinitolerans]MCP2280809.1 Short-chain dehydrogenase [Nocardia amikacinitolerans]MCP2297219.1 Short-chain dehydrogenase [Nocardia amikacinitolerans]SNY88411.1 Short-chain dehydrogenase [Nocardia amikacinitolerans]
MTHRPTALITGASAGLGRALARALVERGWRVIGTARRADRLEEVRAELGAAFVAVAGDVTDPAHRARLAEIAEGAGPLDLVVNNASTLGPSPMPRLADFPLDELEAVYRTNVVAPLAVLQAALPLLGPDGVIVDISSDAAVEPYPGWGGYGPAKAALDQLTAILAAEHPELAVYSFDPGDMRTEMHQAAFPGEDISDRPEPESVVPALLRMLDERPKSGRYTAADFAVAR